MNSEPVLKTTFHLNQLKNRLKVRLPTCKSCHYERRMNHYCMERGCTRKQLVCLECDVRQPHSTHYGHRFCYVLPLLSSNAARNLEEVADTVRQFKTLVTQEIEKIHVYIKSLQSVLKKTQKALSAILTEKQARGLDTFQKLATSFRSGQDVNLQQIFKQVNFPMNSQCRQKISEFRQQMKAEIDKLNWISDPEKAFREKLQEKQELQGSVQPAFLSDRTVQITDVDSKFKQYYEVYTNRLKQNQVRIKLDTEYSNKARMFQNFIYHFQNCRLLSIQNINLNHCKSVLAFPKLKQLQLACNNQCQSFQDFKSEFLLGVSSQLTCFKLKKIKQEDAKVIKHIRELFPSLLELQLQFNNRYDMCSCKDLIDFLKGTDNRLLRFSLKFRTENDIKRLFGNFSKFIKQSSIQNPLEDHLIRYLSRHPNLTRINLDGVRLRKTPELFSSILTIKKLVHFKLVLMDCVEQLPQVTQIQKEVAKNRRILTLLQGLVMRSQIARCSGALAVEKILDITISD